MYKRIILIGIFVLLNLLLGRLFQNTVGSLCFIELGIFAISSFLFWNIIANSIKSWHLKWHIFQDFKTVCIHAALGLTTTLCNVLIGQGLIFIYGYFMYNNYVSFNYKFLNASHTNHIAVNLLCYFSLVLYYLNTTKEEEKIPTNKDDIATNNKISVSRAGTKFLIAFEELMYVESSNNCIVLHTEKGKFVKYQSLKSFQETLPEGLFVRTHRSFLVNKDFIESISKNKNGDGLMRLNSGDELKFSRTYQFLIPQ